MAGGGGLAHLNGKRSDPSEVGGLSVRDGPEQKQGGGGLGSGENMKSYSSERRHLWEWGDGNNSSQMRNQF